MSSAWWLGHSCMLGFGARSLTPQNIQRTGECVLNLPSVGEVGAVNRLARTTGSDPVPPHKLAMGYRHVADKFGVAGLTAARVVSCVRPPRVRECPVHLEATLESVHPLAVRDDDRRGALVALELRIVRVHVDESIRMAGHADRIDPEQWRPLIMSFQQFFGLGEIVHDSTLERRSPKPCIVRAAWLRRRARPSNARTAECVMSAASTTRAGTQWSRATARSDGEFVYAVRTTGVYCKPSCASRRALRENVTLLRGAGCGGGGRFSRVQALRSARDGERDRVASIAKARAYIETHVDESPSLGDAARKAVGMSASHLQRTFKRARWGVAAEVCRRTARRSSQGASARGRDSEQSDVRRRLRREQPRVRCGRRAARDDAGRATAAAARAWTFDT